MAFRISFDTGVSFEREPDCAVSLAMKRAGARATLIGCRGGGCGVCRVQVLDGKFHTSKMSREHVSPEEAGQGFVLGCRLYAESDLMLRAAPREP